MPVCVAKTEGRGSVQAWSPNMIRLQKRNGDYIYINECYIESMEENPDTTIYIHNGTRFVVVEKPEEILAQIARSRPRQRVS